MSQIKTTCHLCGETSKSHNTLASCPICGVNLQNSKEVMLKKTTCITSEGTEGVHTRKGVLLLSNQRIFWLKQPSRRRLFGSPRLTDMIMDAIFPYPKVMKFSYRLNEITDIQILKKGIFKVLTLTIDDKVIVLDIKNKHKQEWIDAVNKARENFRQ